MKVYEQIKASLLYAWFSKATVCTLEKVEIFHHIADVEVA
jgi:hypothetical protein